MTMALDRRAFLLLASAALATPALASQGRIETLPPIEGGPRVRIWLPPGYETSGRHYPTLYMLDGQVAFAGDLDKVNFAADERMARLAAAGKVRPTLIVAIDNAEGDRFLQYMPQAIYDKGGAGVRATVAREIARTGGRPLTSAAFIEYLTTRLKPLVDRTYRTLPGRLDTGIFGASMGGIMAAAIFIEAQRSFGRAGCMSPNWPIYDKNFIDHPELLTLWPDYFARLGAPAGRRLWMDHGTKMMDAGMAPHQANIAARLTELGWRRGRNLRTEVYEGAGHAYAETAVQMDDVLTWLLA